MNYNITPMSKTINIKGSLLDLGAPVVMGILNVTPDSFYKGSRIQSEEHVIARVRQILDEGGTIVDVGAQSTNPKSEFLSAETEIGRLKPTLSLINKYFPDLIISIDTFYADVAKFAVEEHGVAIINDVSGGSIDNNMFQTVAGLNVPYILMHMRGTPQTMQKLTSYDNFIQDIFYYFSEKVAKLNQLGVNDIIIDPGFGFSKTIEQNYELMAALRGFSIFDLPLLVGISRKGMIYRLLNITSDESLNGTTILNTFALQHGANILRVHDVKEAVEAVKVVQKLGKYKL